MCADKDPITAKESAEMVRQAGGEGFDVVCDVTELEQVRNLADASEDWFGKAASLVINNAGIGAGGNRIGATSVEDWNAAISVNLWGVIHGCETFVPRLRSNGRGGVINVGSITGYAPAPYMASYCASKAFVRSFSWALSAELAGTGVTVTCLTTGIVRTAFFDRETMRRTRLTKILPRNDAAVVAKVGWKAFKAGRPIAIPRFIDRYVIHLCWLLPDRLLARLIGALQRID